MAGQTKVRTLTYLRATFSDGSRSLQALVQTALNGKAKTADKRSEKYSSDVAHLRLINEHRKSHKMLFGQFVVFEPGRKQPLVHLADGKEYYKLDTKSAEANEAFADEVFYFGLRVNDVVVIQTSAIRARNFETHLAWLLKDCACNLDADAILALKNQPAPEVYKRLEKSPVKSIRVGSHIDSFEMPAPDAKGQKTRTKTGRLERMGAVAAQILKTLLEPDAYKQLRFEEGLDEANLVMSVEFKFVRKTTEDGQNAMDAIATGFRHLEDTDYEVKLKNGGTIKGEEMKIAQPISVRYLDSGLVEETDLYQKMHAFLIETLKGQE